MDTYREGSEGRARAASNVPAAMYNVQCLMYGQDAPCRAWRAAEAGSWASCYSSSGARRTDVPHGECDCMFAFENAVRTHLSRLNPPMRPAAGANLLDPPSWGGNTAEASNAMFRAIDSLVCTMPQCQASASATCVQPELIRLRQASASACHRASSCSITLGNGASSSGMRDAACATIARGCGWGNVRTCDELDAASAAGGAPCDVASEDEAVGGQVSGGVAQRPGSVAMLCALLLLVAALCALSVCHRMRGSGAPFVRRR